MLQTAMIFTDKMVLQRRKKIPVWGTGIPGTEVRVCLEKNGGVFSRATACTKTITRADGNWMAELPPQEAGTDFTLTIWTEKEKMLFQDVCVGEVWIAGGQSNMEYLLGFEKHFDEAAEKERNPLIRFFDYPEVSYEGELEDRDYKNYGFWRGCTKEDLGYFSAVGYYFARNLQKDLSVPVGIVGCNWGGTSASCWMDPKFLEGTKGECWLESYAKELEKIGDLDAYKETFRCDPANDKTHLLEDPVSIKFVKEGLSREEQLQAMQPVDENRETPPIGPYHERRPGGLYETMLKKIVPYAMRGVIWYQGESEVDSHGWDVYDVVLSKLIENWRILWKEEFPFLFVQLAPFGRWLDCSGELYPIIRKCQEKVSKTVPGTWMASIGDAGMEWDIHPKDKLPVGERLALLARGHVYGEDLLCDAPEFESAEWIGEDLALTFANDTGLYIEGAKLNAMQLLDAWNNPVEFSEAFVENNRLILKGCGGARRISFAETAYYEVNLYNKAHIPAKPFETEAE